MGLQGKAAGPKQKPSSSDDDKLVWTREQIKREIEKLENQLGVAVKHHINRIILDKDKLLVYKKDGNQPIVLGKEAQKATTTGNKSKPVPSGEAKPTSEESESNSTPAGNVESQLIEINDKFQEQDLLGAQDILIKCKNDLNVLISTLPRPSQLAYFMSIWGFVPILSAALGLVMALVASSCFGNVMILGMVPFWASWVAVIGASVQIFVGVVQDYKEDGKITEYKRLWYIVILFVSFAFGFLAFLLAQAGLLNISQGQIVLNQAFNQTITTTTVTQVGTNQTLTQTATQSGTTSNLTIPLILCFLAGYATDWFMGLLGKIAHTDGAKK